ncbi:DEAD/DEAH box helicase [Candidatus Pacearchaeota archaeon]|nr:DEAD/DEAH box helicase [Candidatus Pacearchaeota archaeon]
MELIKKSGFTEPSEIQEKTIPLVMKGRDIIGGSATGSGKTLAFGTGIIEAVIPGKGLQSLILTPTRELAEQIGTVFKKFSGYKKLNVSVVYGGVNIGHQIRELQKSEIVVGTPGRILDHLERGTINFSDLKILVLDEADRMLDMGFIRDVEKIIKNCPKERQTLLFSATISMDIEHLAKRYMKNPETISVEAYVDAKKLRQVYYDVQKNMKFSLLVNLLKRETPGLIMVFCNTRHNTDFVADNLKRLGVDAIAIHGGLTQDKRTKIMQKFHEKKVYVLVCTDIAARGLDIKGVSHVYNYDIPKTSKEYIHRIGRTARAGKEGIAINILSDRDYENFNNVLRDEALYIEKEEVPEIQQVRIMLENPRGQRRNRWDSDNWKARQQGRERHGMRRERRSRGNEGRGERSFGERSRSQKKFSGRRNIRQRSGKYLGGGRRKFGMKKNFSRGGGRGRY